VKVSPARRSVYVGRSNSQAAASGQSQPAILRVASRVLRRIAHSLMVLLRLHIAMIDTTRLPGIPVGTIRPSPMATGRRTTTPGRGRTPHLPADNRAIRESRSPALRGNSDRHPSRLPVGPDRTGRAQPRQPGPVPDIVDESRSRRGCPWMLLRHGSLGSGPVIPGHNDSPAARRGWERGDPFGDRGSG